MTRIKPCGHKVVVLPQKVETEKDIGGGKKLIVTVGSDAVRREQLGVVRGTLIAIGPQAWKAFKPDFTGEPWASIGDTVLFSKYAGVWEEDPDTKEQVYIMNDDDIHAVIGTEK